MNAIATVGIDLAKNVFQIHGVDAAGSVVVRRKLRRGQVLAFVAHLEPWLIGMEVCAGAHFWARELTALGHEARLMLAAYVNPYDNAMMESLMKTLKVEGVYPLEFETAEDIAKQIPAFIEKYNARRLHSSLGYLSPDQYEKKHTRPLVKDAA